MAKKVKAAAVCTPVRLPDDDLPAAAAYACEVNPANAPARALDLSPSFLTALTSAYWGPGGVDLSVGFLEQTPNDLRDRILSHMSAWGDFANVKFRWSQQAQSADVRITRSQQGYWSYLGTQIRQIRKGAPTMCLQAFTMKTPESEYRRVVRHETGHTLGFPHEHMLPAIIALLDEQKVIEYFGRTQGWRESEVRAQVLTPLDPAKIITTDRADQVSIMTYQLPGQITKSGQPILGGDDFSDLDRQFAARLYPKAVAPPPPPPPPTGGKLTVQLVIDPATRTVESASVA